jgi:hypothetical protein
MGNEHCMDGDRLCTTRRVQQERRDEQEYLDKHNPRRFSLPEIALLLLVVVLAFDAVRSAVFRPSIAGPHPVASAASSDERDHPHDWRRFGYDLDLRR